MMNPTHANYSYHPLHSLHHNKVNPNTSYKLGFISITFLILLLFLAPWSDEGDKYYGSDFPHLNERFHQPSWKAEVKQCADLYYSSGANEAEDRLAFIRSASSVRWINSDRIAITQDDTHFIGLVDVKLNPPGVNSPGNSETHNFLELQRVVSLALPRGPGNQRQYDTNRDNKRLKFDLESSVYIPAALSPTKESFILIFGSGSKHKRRDIIFYIKQRALEKAEDVVLEDHEYGYVPADWQEEIYGVDLDDQGNTIHEKHKHRAKESNKDNHGEEEDKDKHDDEHEETHQHDGHDDHQDRKLLQAKPKTKSNRPSSSTQEKLVILYYAEELFDSLRENKAFSGSELNIEGVDLLSVVKNEETQEVENYFRIFQRGNGKNKGDLKAVSASADIKLSDFFAYLNALSVEDHQTPLFSTIAAPEKATAPALHRITQYSLGYMQSIPLTFTDIHIWSQNNAETEGIVYLAGAEASPDTYNDGKLSGIVLGFLPSPRETEIFTDSVGSSLRADGSPHEKHSKKAEKAHNFASKNWNPLLHSDGSVFRAKAEGLVIWPNSHAANSKQRPESTKLQSLTHLFTPELPLHVLAVIDQDDPHTPAQICYVQVNANA
jgi:hypothetical protein